jgi:hypothetical protein
VDTTFQPSRSVLRTTAAPRAVGPGCTLVEARPACVDLTFTRGDTLAFLIRLWEDAAHTVPADLSAAVVTAQVRKTATATTVEAEFTVAVVTNEITLSLPPAETQTLPATAVWDCQVDWYGDATTVRTVASGTVTVLQDVTRV